MMRRKRAKRAFRIFLVLLGFAVLLVWQTNLAVLNGADKRIFLNSKDVPSMPFALVLWTSPKNREGGRNLFFERRMDAASELFREGKIRKILVSGDNGTRYYDEPTAMKSALMSRGIPERDIVLDFAGFRTLDSVIRAHKVFHVDRCVIVTDDFHLPRALYIAREEGIEAVGFQTQPLPRSVSPWTFVREIAARSLVWIDVKVLNRQPKYL